MKRTKVFLLFALLCFAVACSDDDSSDNADAGPSDDSGNNLATDGGANVTTTDAGAGEDSGGSMDASAADSGSDTGSEDAGGEDAGSEDAGGTDAGAGGEGCAAGFNRVVGVDGVIVACTGPADSVDQCEAESVCGTGWHMCTASEYRAQYEAMEPPAVDMTTLWIAGCIRDGADPQAPADGVCADCSGTQLGSEEDVAFSCVNAVRISTEQLYVGLRAGAACSFAGVDAAGNDAYWSAQPAATKQGGAFCCAD